MNVVNRADDDASGTSATVRPNKLAEHKQRAAMRGSTASPPVRRKGSALCAHGSAAPLPRPDGMRGWEVFSP